MKLTRQDVPYFLAAAAVVYVFSIGLLYFILWLMSLVFPMPEIPVLGVLFIGLILTSIAYVMDTKKYK